MKIRLICARLAAAALAICLAFTSCGIIGEEGGASSGPGQDVGSYESGESDTSSGDASSDGATSGGTSSGGTSSGDATSGGTSSGGASSGGVSSDDATSGDASSGGASSGGTSSDGTSSGGASSGGATSGGTSSGGASSGGASSGGASSDDASSGGTSSGFEPGADGNWEIIDRDSPVTLSEYYWRSTLNTAERKIYDAVAYAASTVSETASFASSPTDAVTLKKVIELFLLDHPEVFWWGRKWTYYGIDDENMTKVEIEFIYDRAEILAMRSELEAAAEGIIARLPADATDFEAALFFHDWLGENVVYKAPPSLSSPEDYQAYTVYGALINGEGVCECYSEAFQFLCHMAGIPAIGITGTADNGSVTENHKWNGVKLGGEWYLVDATWDDAGEYGVRHSYFGMTGADMANHFVSEDLKEGLPAFDSDKASYYVYYGLMCDGSDPEEAVVRGLELAKEKDGDTFLLELRGTDADAAADCFALLKANGSRRLRAIIDTYNRLNGTDYSLDSYFSVSDMNTLCYIISK